MERGERPELEGIEWDDDRERPRQPKTRGARREPLPYGFYLALGLAAAATLVPAFTAHERLWAGVFAAGSFGLAAVVTWKRELPAWLEFAEARYWPADRAIAAFVLWGIGVLSATAALGAPPVNYHRPGQVLLIGALALWVLLHLVGAAVWRWTLLRRARALAPDVERRVRRLVSQHERGLITSQELRDGWAAARKGVPEPPT